LESKKNWKPKAGFEWFLMPQMTNGTRRHRRKRRIKNKSPERHPSIHLDFHQQWNPFPIIMVNLLLQRAFTEVLPTRHGFFLTFKKKKKREKRTQKVKKRECLHIKSVGTESPPYSRFVWKKRTRRRAAKTSGNIERVEVSPVAEITSYISRPRQKLMVRRPATQGYSRDYVLRRANSELVGWRHIWGVQEIYAAVGESWGT
jgi:hypothetical protein